MNRLPRWAVVAIGVVLFLFAIMGITNSEHAIAKVVYAALIIGSVAVVTVGLRRSVVTRPHRESGHRET